VCYFHSYAPDPEDGSPPVVSRYPPRCLWHAEHAMSKTTADLEPVRATLSALGLPIWTKSDFPCSADPGKMSKIELDFSRGLLCRRNGIAPHERCVQTPAIPIGRHRAFAETSPLATLRRATGRPGSSRSAPSSKPAYRWRRLGGLTAEPRLLPTYQYENRECLHSLVLRPKVKQFSSQLYL